MKKQFIIIRGIAGSGKSTLAKSISTPGTIWAEADHYFTNFMTGQYNFDVTKIVDAHDACKKKIEDALKDDYTTKIIVSNTFTTKKELVPYFAMAKLYHTKPQVITVESLFKNIHNVPETTLEAMKKRFDKHCVKDLFEEYFP